MLNKKLKLNESVFNKDVEKSPTRNGFGEGLVLAGEKDDRIVVLCADLAESTRASVFRDKYPNRFIEVGVAEQLLATLGAGFAAYGKIPFIASYAAFSPGRNWEQIRTAIALNDVPVKIAGCHAGVSVGEDGATHQALEDIATMRVIPNMIVVYPCDVNEAVKVTYEAAFNSKPTYIRFAREATPVITSKDTPFEIGKAQVFWESKNPQVTIIAAGPLVYEALSAANKLDKLGIESTVINCHTIKPLDTDTILQSVMATGCVVTVEEHQIAGGLGGAIAETLSQNYPVPMEFIGMHDTFGESGKPDQLLKKYGMKSDDIVIAAKKVIKRKNS
ncbi:transketolase family protein [Candidatus Woesebacteria bacterium]|nr:MAG: transketolase family protein [Candidatus Woesebacteria bacterium]